MLTGKKARKQDRGAIERIARHPDQRCFGQQRGRKAEEARGIERLVHHTARAGQALGEQVAPQLCDLRHIVRFGILADPFVGDTTDFIREQEQAADLAPAAHRAVAGEDLFRQCRPRTRRAGDEDRIPPGRLACCRATSSAMFAAGIAADRSLGIVGSPPCGHKARGASFPARRAKCREGLPHDRPAHRAPCPAHTNRARVAPASHSRSPARPRQCAGNVRRASARLTDIASESHAAPMGLQAGRALKLAARFVGLAQEQRRGSPAIWSGRPGPGHSAGAST